LWIIALKQCLEQGDFFEIPNPKSQNPNKFQSPMTKRILFRILNLDIGAYLGFGLPARSRFGEGRCLEFGAFFSIGFHHICLHNPCDVSPVDLHPHLVRDFNGDDVIFDTGDFPVDTPACQHILSGLDIFQKGTMFLRPLLLGSNQQEVEDNKD
jgi:hypothetical protein